ncbi:hypothetical protein GKE82_17190 [Conexibacter sp. W3-3-2]|uniref:PucR family transcriptional regulator n=1 Tax=Conexibacter sp. W3-3-2 TaxID=2675227 RepID=UPI0012B95CC1|nr:helix-turn-helix domain-containing protein [Conexibacter sp. W3-3-2]MTD45974.1 hypothetical protein [Conexibacter sp. W3-3-2]
MPTSRIARALRAERDDLVAVLLERRVEVPAFAELDDDAVARLGEEVGALVDTLADALDHDRPLDVEDVAVLRPAIEARAARGDWIEQTTRGLRIAQRTIYERVAAIAGETGDPAAVVLVGARLLELMDVAGALAAQAWVEAREVTRSGGTERRRALLDTLLEGGDPELHGLGDLARDLGLVPGASVVAVSARAVTTATAGRTLTSAVGALARAGKPVMLPLAGLVDDEIVIVRPVVAEELDDVVAALERAWRRLADGPVRLALGVSARHALPDGARDAIADARRARARVPTGGGVLALPTLAPLDWMALRAGDTTWTLVPEPLRRFLEEDAADGGQLLHTFASYVASDLNVKVAARRLHVHVNTARYRLGRISERTGLDLRSLDDVIALHVASLLFERRRGD